MPGTGNGGSFGDLMNEIVDGLRHDPGYTIATYAYDAMNRLVETRRDGELNEKVK